MQKRESRNKNAQWLNPHVTIYPFLLLGFCVTIICFQIQWTRLSCVVVESDLVQMSKLLVLFEVFKKSWFPLTISRTWMFSWEDEFMSLRLVYPLIHKNQNRTKYFNDHDWFSTTHFYYKKMFHTFHTLQCLIFYNYKRFVQFSTSKMIDFRTKLESLRVYRGQFWCCAHDFIDWIIICKILNRLFVEIVY